jgi:hypothetical protein
MTRGGQGLPKVSPEPTMPTLLLLAARPNLKRPFQGWPAHKMGGLWPSFTLLDTPGRTPMEKTPGGGKSWKRRGKSIWVTQLGVDDVEAEIVNIVKIATTDNSYFTDEPSKSFTRSKYLLLNFIHY